MKRLKAKMAVFAAIVVAMLMPAMMVFAASPVTIDLSDEITKGMNMMVGEIMLVIAAIIPIALGLVGVVIAIRKGISLMRSMVS